jgi:hypothetical protein
MQRPDGTSCWFHRIVCDGPKNLNWPCWKCPSCLLLGCPENQLTAQLSLRRFGVENILMIDPIWAMSLSQTWWSSQTRFLRVATWILVFVSEIKLFEHRLQWKVQRRLVSTMKVPLLGNLKAQLTVGGKPSRMKKIESHETTTMLRLWWMHLKSITRTGNKELDARRREAMSGFVWRRHT